MEKSTVEIYINRDAASLSPHPTCLWIREPATRMRTCMPVGSVLISRSTHPCVSPISPETYQSGATQVEFLLRPHSRNRPTETSVMALSATDEYFVVIQKQQQGPLTLKQLCAAFFAASSWPQRPGCRPEG